MDLSESEKKYLWKHRRMWSGHSKWMVRVSARVLFFDTYAAAILHTFPT
jgi:hypothetical protein